MFVGKLCGYVDSGKYICESDRMCHSNDAYYRKEWEDGRYSR